MLADDLVEAVQRARIEATIRRDKAVTSCHLGAAGLRVAGTPDSPVGRALAGSGVDRSAVIEALLDHAGAGLRTTPGS